MIRIISKEMDQLLDGSVVVGQTVGGTRTESCALGLAQDGEGNIRVKVQDRLWVPDGEGTRRLVVSGVIVVPLA